MKLLAILSAALFATLTAASLGAQAADPAPAAEAQSAKQAAKAVKPHSHMEEKTGIPAAAAPAADGKVKADKDKTKHYHPRDAK